MMSKRVILLALLAGGVLLGASTWAVSGVPPEPPDDTADPEFKNKNKGGGGDHGNGDDDRCATIYKKKHFQGGRKHLDDGDKDGDLGGGWDNEISSLKVYDDCELHVWKGKHYQGDHKKYEHNRSQLGPWDDKISSYKCECEDDHGDDDDDHDDDDNHDDDDHDDDDGGGGHGGGH